MYEVQKGDTEIPNIYNSLTILEYNSPKSKKEAV